MSPPPVDATGLVVVLQAYTVAVVTLGRVDVVRFIWCETIRTDGCSLGKVAWFGAEH